MTRHAPRLHRTSLLAALSIGLSSLLLLGGLELALRLGRGSLFATPLDRFELLRSSFPTSHDPLLGHVPTPGARTTMWQGSWPVTITTEGTRSNQGPPQQGRPVLAVGDSFTFGDEVGDDQTWPAQLELLLGRPVVNGGVFGYGFDQIVLRAEQLVDRFAPAALVVAFIPDDVLRCEFAYRYAWKPYFDVVDGGLVLRNVPVPEGPPPDSRWGLGRSHLFRFVRGRLDPDAAAIPDALRAHRQGLVVARLLVDRLAGLAGLAAQRSLPVLLVLQWVPGSDVEPGRATLARARELGLATLDVEPTLRRATGGGEPAGLALFFQAHRTARGHALGHMNAAGNRAVAALVAREMARLGIAQGSRSD